MIFSSKPLEVNVMEQSVATGLNMECFYFYFFKQKEGSSLQIIREEPSTCNKQFAHWTR